MIDNKSLPQLLDAQIGVIGSMLIDEHCVGPVLMVTHEKQFVTQAYKTIYRAIRSLFSQAKPVDAITVRDYLKREAGADYSDLIRQVLVTTPTAANVDAYVEILKRDSVVWHLKELGNAMADVSNYDEAMRLLDKANAYTADKSDAEIWDMRRGWDNFVQRHQPDTAPDYLDWGIAELNDRIHAGPGTFAIIGGYSSDGKTCLALSFAMRMAKTKRVGFFSFETDAAALTDRMLSAKALVRMNLMASNRLNEKDWEELSYAAGELSSGGLRYMQCSGYSAADIQAVALSQHFDVVIIDYLQLIDTGRSRNGRSEDVAEISRSLQQMARRNKIAVIALSQLTPGVDAKKKAPSYYDLRDSKQQTMDADVILLLYKEVFEDKTSPRILSIAKNRNGEAGAGIRLKFDGATQTFSKAVNQHFSAPEKKKDEQVSFKEIMGDGRGPF